MWKTNGLFRIIQELVHRIPNWKLTQNSRDDQHDQWNICFLLRRKEEKLLTASKKR